MKKRKFTIQHSNDSALISRIQLILLSDLRKQAVADASRFILNTLRKRGYRPLTTDLDHPECIPCLYIALESAADFFPRNVSRIAEQIPR